MINTTDSLVLLIDMQEKLVRATHADTATTWAERLIKACRLLHVPIVVTEQNPKGLGMTLPQIMTKLPTDTPVLNKTSFSALDTPTIVQTLTHTHRRQVILTGIETHICVFQTAVSLKTDGYDVFILSDACASRFNTDAQTALTALRNLGCTVLTTEMLLFLWIKDATHPCFKEIQSLIKDRQI